MILLQRSRRWVLALPGWVAALLVAAPEAAHGREAAAEAEAEVTVEFAEVSDAGEEETLTLSVGSQSILRAEGLERVSVGDPAVADVAVVDDAQVLVVGQAPGRTSLILWADGARRTVAVEVVGESAAAEIEEAAEMLGLSPLLEIREIGDRVVVDGEIRSVTHLERYRTLRRHWPDATYLVRVDPALFEEIAERINVAMKEAGLKEVEATAVAGVIFLEGTVTDEHELRKANRIAEAIHGDIDPSRLEAD